MTRKIQLINTQQIFAQDASNPTPTRVTGRLLWVQGEADGKPTYDFTIALVRVYNAASGETPILTVSTRYVGTRNGAKVMLFNDYPQVSTPAQATTNTGFYEYINVYPGEGVNLQVFTNFGNLINN